MPPNPPTKTQGAPAGGVVLMEGGHEEYRHESDTEKLFRQESSFAYLFGVRALCFTLWTLGWWAGGLGGWGVDHPCNQSRHNRLTPHPTPSIHSPTQVKEPGFFGAIEVGTGRTTLFIPRLPAEYAVWMGPILPPAHFQAHYEVEAVKYVDELPAFFTAVRPPVVYRNRGFNTDSGNEARPASLLGDGVEAALKAAGAEVDDEVLYPELVECRVHKTAREVALLQYVNDVSSDAHLAVMAGAKPGMAEFQLESTFLHECYFRGGCRHVAYTSICACGPNNAVLHYGGCVRASVRATAAV